MGGVILNLDQDFTLRAFKRLGVDLEEINARTTLFTDYEIGKISDEDFRHGLRTYGNPLLTDEQIDTAWNRMLLDLPVERFALLDELNKRYKLYLLSNTNNIHITEFYRYVNSTYNNLNFNGFFQEVYLSHLINLRKPNEACYEFVLKQQNIKREECIFIDDSIANINGAKKCGIHTLHAIKPLDDSMVAAINTYK